MPDLPTLLWSLSAVLLYAAMRRVEPRGLRDRTAHWKRVRGAR